MDKNTILDYVTETPGNTNRAVLGSMLDSIGGGDSGSGSNISLIHLIREYDEEGYSTNNLTADKTYTEMAEEGAKNICIAMDNTILPLHRYQNTVYSFWIDSSNGSDTIYVHKISALQTSAEWTEQSITIISK